MTRLRRHDLRTSKSVFVSYSSSSHINSLLYRKDTISLIITTTPSPLLPHLLLSLFRVLYYEPNLLQDYNDTLPRSFLFFAILLLHSQQCRIKVSCPKHITLQPPPPLKKFVSFMKKQNINHISIPIYVQVYSMGSCLYKIFLFHIWTSQTSWASQANRVDPALSRAAPLPFLHSSPLSLFRFYRNNRVFQVQQRGIQAEDEIVEINTLTAPLN